MEDRAPYHPEAPKGPRNLGAELATWLRRQGFAATEQVWPGTMELAAHWLSSGGERFQLTYTWMGLPVPSATCRLEVYQPGQLAPETLFTAQHVRRLREARTLLLNCVRYANARLLAPVAPQPPSLSHLTPSLPCT